MDNKNDKYYVKKEIMRLNRKGLSSLQIAQEVGCSKSWVNRVIKRNGNGRNVIIEDLIDENTKYADNRVVLEKVTIDGKLYTDITPVFAPR